ncbi:MAG: GNAT family N-acetyltransferase [Leptolyngbyaceae cyanobacterium]
MHIRQATLADVDPLVALSKRTFFDAFAADNASTDMELHLATQFTLDKIEQQLTDARSVFFIAYPTSDPNNNAVGYAQLIRDAPVPNFESTEKAIELSKLYVDQAVVGQGYGSRLMQTCIDYATTQQFSMLWLGVWEHNTRAQTFYRRWGFEPVGTQPFVLGRDVQTDDVLVRAIAPATS